MKADFNHFSVLHLPVTHVVMDIGPEKCDCNLRYFFLVMLSTLGTIYFLKLLIFPHWESLSAAYKELFTLSGLFDLPLRLWQLLVLYGSC